MRLFLGVCALLALPFAFLSGVASAAAGDEPSAVNLIFDHKHLSNVEQGSEVEYKFNRSVSDARLLGEPFSDEITVKVVASKPTGEKDVDLQIYTGERARDLQKMPGLTINPIFLVYLEQAVNSFSMLSGGKHSYLKRVFSMALKDKAKVEPIKLQYKGKQIDAYRISVSPYVDDRNASKMEGWEKAKFVIILSEQVPGEVIDMHSTFENPLVGNLKLQERITLSGVEGLQ
ncbi:MAG: hypothetical protein V3V65_02130 [Hyphomicrobium sp.]